MLATAAPASNLPAELLRRGYVLLSRIGEGATAEIFAARHRASSRDVAVKVSRGDVPEAALIAARMRTAWNVGRGMRHPHLVATLDGGALPDGRAWLVMERLVGHDLQAELDAHPRLTASRTVHVVRQVCEALLVLHRRGAVHRDVKPENIFLCAGGHFDDHIKLIDLGTLALAEDDPLRAHEPTGAFIMGTPLYLAPELARGERPDGRADLYSVGAVLFHLITGRPPFEGDDPTAVVAAHVNDPVPSVLELMPETVPCMAELIEACLSKQPSERPESAAELMRRLDRCAHEMAGGLAPIPSFQRAGVPAVPPPGLMGDWTHFSESLERNIAACWHGIEAPRVLTAALEWVHAARKTLEEAVSRSEARRAQADTGARARIEAQTRLDALRPQVRATLAEAERQRAEAQNRVEQAIAHRDRIDERYREAVNALAALGGGEIGAVDPADGLPLSATMREALAARNEADVALRTARQAQQEAAEQVALTLAEEVEIERSYADLRLEEEDDGHRREMLAAVTADDALCAQRAFENACARAWLTYIERAGF